MEKKWDTVTPADLKKTLCMWDIYVPLVTKGLNKIINNLNLMNEEALARWRAIAPNANKQTNKQTTNNLNLQHTSTIGY